MSLLEVTVEYVTDVTDDGNFRQEFSLSIILERKKLRTRVNGNKMSTLQRGKKK